MKCSVMLLWQVARLQLQVLNALQRLGKGLGASVQVDLCEAQQRLQSDLMDITQAWNLLCTRYSTLCMCVCVHACVCMLESVFVCVCTCMCVCVHL